MYISFCQSLTFPSDASKRASILWSVKYNCSFFSPWKRPERKHQRKGQNCPFCARIIPCKNGSQRGSWGVKMGAGICLFMFPRKWDLLHWVWDLTVVKDFSYDTCCLSPKTLLNLCHAFYKWASGSDDRGNPISRIDVNKLIDWLICFLLWEGVSLLSWSLTRLFDTITRMCLFFCNRREYSVPVEASRLP